MARILIADDDGACRRLLREYLAPFGRCDLAYDGREAIAAFRIALEGGEPYDLVLLDILMPGADGHRVLDRIREIEQEHNIGGSDGVKVIMTTGLADTKHCVRAFREGCESYLTKPFHRQDLNAHVSFHLGWTPEPTRA
jgi:two-component system, chemotaxis family, chemotaxis protein CheY